MFDELKEVVADGLVLGVDTPRAVPGKPGPSSKSPTGSTLGSEHHRVKLLLVAPKAGQHVRKATLLARHKTLHGSDRLHSHASQDDVIPVALRQTNPNIALNQHPQVVQHEPDLRR